jgi:hypothetical protein
VELAIAAAAAQYSPQLLDLVRWCMKINPLERPQSVFSLQRALAEAPPVPAAKPVALPMRWLESLSFRRRRRERESVSTALWPSQKGGA